MINPLANRTIDELGVGSSRSSVDALLGESVSGPASGAGHVVYVADREKGLAWDVTYGAAGRVVVIVLCHCMPPSNDLPAGMSRQWELHGLNLTIRDDGRAVSVARTYSGMGPGSGSCDDKECAEVKDFRVTVPSATTLKLTVTSSYRAPLVLSEDGSMQAGDSRFPSEDSEVAVGDYYTLAVQSDGNALTTLYSADGVEKTVSKFNGLGSPWICSPDHHDPQKCGA